MKRFGLSILGGVLVPVIYIEIYCALVSIASDIFHIWRSPGVHAFAERMEPILLRPISWPSKIHFHFYPPPEHEFYRNSHWGTSCL